MLFYKWSPIISIIIIISKKYIKKITKAKQETTKGSKKKLCGQRYKLENIYILRWNAIEKMQMNKMRIAYIYSFIGSCL